MSQPSGWYDDPQDPAYLRYFDGVTWTDHRAPKVAPQVQQSHIGEGAQVDDFRRDGRPDAQPPQTSSPYVVGPDQGTGQGRGPGQGYGGGQGYGAGRQPWGQPGGAGQGSYGPQASLGATATTADGQPLAGWGRRFLAMVLDNLLLYLLLSPVLYAAMRDYLPRAREWIDEVGRLAAQGSTTTPPDPPMPDSGTLMAVALTWLIGYLVYEVTLLATLGRTPGRMATGISVRAVERPTPAPVDRLLIRTVVKRFGDLVPIPFVGILFTMLDGLWPLADKPLRQAIHDKPARTCVVRGKVGRRR